MTKEPKTENRKPKTENSQSYEDNLKRLEEILQLLEHGDLPLETALRSFEEGMRLVQVCNQKLDQVEKKVEILLRDEKGQLIIRPFATPGEEEGN